MSLETTAPTPAACAPCAPHRPLAWDLGFLGLWLLLVNLLAAWFVGQEHFRYFWDYSNYWERWMVVGDNLRHSPAGAITDLLVSVRYADYNHIAALILLPFGFLFGWGRLPYILGIVNLLALPGAVAFLFLMHLLAGRWGWLPRWKPALSALALLVLLLLPAFWDPLLFGYVDVGGVALVFVMLWVYFQAPGPEISWKRLGLLALLAVALLLFRRAYSFWVLSFYLVVGLDTLLGCLKARDLRPADYLLALAKVLASGLAAFALFWYLATPLALRILTTDYAQVYSAWRHGAGFWQPLWAVAARLGLFQVAWLAAAALVALADKATRRVALFLLVQMALILVLFTRVQNFDPHHYYLILPALLVLSVTLLLRLLQWGRRGRAVLAGYFLVSCLSMAVVFIPAAGPGLAFAAPLWPGARHAPLVRHDIDELNLLVGRVLELSADPGGLVYVLASSSTLNPDIIRIPALQSVLGTRNPQLVLNPAEVDLRDGFPRDLPAARFVVVASPIQYNLDPSAQRVVGIPAQLILEGQGLGRAYRRLSPDFTLQGGVKAFIYQRMRPLSRAEIEALSQALIAAHPENPYPFELGPAPGARP